MTWVGTSPGNTQTRVIWNNKKVFFLLPDVRMTLLSYYTYAFSGS